MKLSRFSLTVFAASAASVAYSFAPTPAFVRVASGTASTGTTLYISSWGKADAGTDTTLKNANPSTNIQAYLEEPDAVDPRPNLEGSILVSGFVNEKERTDQFVFDLLNHEDSAFEYKKFVAFVDDEKFAKKRLLSRSARYTGLLDKLEFKEAAVEGALPVAAQLEGIDSWLATVEANGVVVEKVKAIAALAKDASELENLSVMVTNAAGESISAADRVSVVEALKDTGKDYTLLVIGKLEDRDEGKTPYKFRNFDSDDDEEALLPEDAVFSREEAVRMVTETLQLEAGANKALTFSEALETNTTEAKLIKGLREAGYARCQEIDHLLRDGPANYQKAVDEFDEENPNWGEGVYATDAWWEDPKFIAQVEEAKLSYRNGAPVVEEEEEEEVEKDPRTLEVEKIAAEWAKREFFSQSMAGTVSEEMEEAEFIESVWDRAMFEGDLKYRQMNGEDPDVDAELLDFKTQQERKQQTMLKMAKQELGEILEEEDLGGVDDNVDTD